MALRLLACLTEKLRAGSGCLRMIEFTVVADSMTRLAGEGEAEAVGVDAQHGERMETWAFRTCLLG